VEVKARTTLNPLRKIFHIHLISKDLVGQETQMNNNISLSIEMKFEVKLFTVARGFVDREL
jgi:hypothetical protein